MEKTVGGVGAEVRDSPGIVPSKYLRCGYVTCTSTLMNCSSSTRCRRFVHSAWTCASSDLFGRAVKMSPLWIAFWCFLYLQPTAAQQTEDCLVAVSNRTNGTSIILDCAPDTSTEYEAFLQGQYLSPLIRLRSVLVTHIVNTTTTNKSSFAIFLPLSNAQGVVKLTYSKIGGWEHTFTVIDGVDCKVISVHKVRETYFTACLDSNEKLFIYQLYINSTNLNVSYAQRSIPVDSVNSFSNIVYATLQDGRIFLHRLYVVAERHIRSIVPLDYYVTTLNEELPSDNCHTLEYAGNWVLLATCTDSTETYSVFYDISDQRVLNTTQGTDAIPILCPHSDGRLIVNTTRGVVLYHNWNSNTDIEFILEGSVHSGVCFGDSKTASLVFAYSNTEAEVYAINISHGADNNIHLSSRACLNQNCQPVLTLGKYLIVQERNYDDTVVTQVLNPARNYSIEFEVNLDVAGIALINYPQVDKNDSHNATNDNARNTTNDNPRNSTNDDSQNNVLVITVPLVVVIILLFVTGAIVASAIFIVIRLYGRKTSQLTPEDRERASLRFIILSGRKVSPTPDGNGEQEPCPNNDRQATPQSQRLSATGGNETSSTSETIDPIPCTEPPDNHRRNLTQGHTAPEEEQGLIVHEEDHTTVDPVEESRQPVLHNQTRRSSGDGAEDNYHPPHDP